MFKFFNKNDNVLEGHLAKELIGTNKDKISGYYDTVTLGGAEILSTYKGYEIQLHLKTLNSTVAKELAKFDGEENIGGPCSLFLEVDNRTEDTIEALSEFKGDLIIGDIKNLDRKLSKAFAKFHGYRLWFWGLDKLEEEVADKLAESKAKSLRLILNNKKINSEVAESLAKFGGENLSLEINEIDESIAEELAKFNGKHLILSGFNEIDIGTARGLAKFNGEVLHLPNQAVLTIDTIKELFKCKGFLNYFEKGYLF